jgi:hypothetical protein
MKPLISSLAAMVADSDLALLMRFSTPANENTPRNALDSRSISNETGAEWKGGSDARLPDVLPVRRKLACKVRKEVVKTGPV